MKKILLLLLVVGISAAAQAQRSSIRGQLVDSLDNPLPAATVLLLNPSDSSLVNFASGDAKGYFEIRNVSKGDHLVKIMYLGFRPYLRKVSAPAPGEVIDLGKIRMEPVRTQLEAIEVEAERAPVTVKRDTIEFNAGSFKTKPNAMVEDLLKKLPGVEVDNEGNITAQGEQVQRVMVDGKNFFGTDPRIATRNLPADAVNKVQIFDKKSEQAAFTGIDDGQREKTINLELKEEKRNGAFGNIMGGAGTDNRLAAKASINRFTKQRQLSLLGMGNNTNDQGFSFNDYLNFTGSSQGMMSGGIRTFTIDRQSGIPLNLGNRANGIMTNYAGGANINNTFDKKTEVNGSYFFNYLDHDVDNSLFRESVLQTGKFIFNQSNRQQNSNVNHRANFTLDHKVDTANLLQWRGNFSYNETDSKVNSTSENLAPDHTVLNEGRRQTISSGSNRSMNANLLWRHRFNKKGRNFTSNFSFSINQNEREGFIDAFNRFYGEDPRVEVIQQVNEQDNKSQSYSASLSYTEPMGGREYLEVNYNYQRNLNDVDRAVYDVSNEQRIFLESLSNRYTSDYQYHKTGLNFRITRGDYNIVLGGSLQNTRLRGDLEIQGVQIDRSFMNLLPAIRFNYDFSTTRHLRFDYEGYVQEPSIQQLQPVVDNSDPLNLYVGNPNLRPAYSQNWRMNYTFFDPATFINLFVLADVQYTTNAITQAQTFDEQLVRTTKPVNVGHNLGMGANISLGFPLRKIGSRFSIGANLRNQQGTNLLNDRENKINQLTTGGTIRYNFHHKEILDLNLSAELSRQLTEYEFDQPDQTFINGSYTAETNLTFLKNYQCSVNFDYLVYKSESSGFNRAIPMLNMSVSRFVLKNKSGELRLSVNNLLNRALGVNQTAMSNYVQRETSNSLGRYFMVSFIYALNKHLNPMGVRPGGGGIIRVMRRN